MTLCPRRTACSTLSGTYVVLALCVATACSNEGSARESRGELPRADSHLFTRLPASYTGVRFENRLEPTHDFNVFTYRNFFNGGGVAIGDLNGDGLPEVVLTANQRGPRLYLNRGSFRFRDVTTEAKIGFKGSGAWATGVTLADVNGDGRLDIYVCYSGPADPEKRRNELYLNQGSGSDSVPRFVESAEQYAIADEGYATQASFFDYDRDGKMDLFIINNSPRQISSFGTNPSRAERSRYGGHKLYHNLGGRFVDVTRAAGILEAEMGFGLGLVTSDVNGDGWPDVYVANDFFEKDYLYLNNRDGTFTEAIDREMPVISYASMGMDIADVNNDGLLDVYTTDMLPENEFRLKLTTSFESWDQYQAWVQRGFHHQFTRNMLQRNNGDSTFSDVGEIAGVARTDWSWGALIADLDLDGNKDIFVSNGVARDVTSQDYVSYLVTQKRAEQQAGGGRKPDFLRLIAATTSTKLPNYAFHNEGDLAFTNRSAEWGLDTPGFSTGAAYGDLDGDGALDLVVNNVDDTAFVYRNNARTLSKNKYLQVSLAGDAPNRFAVGARVYVHDGHTPQLQEVTATRGFQSSVDYVLTFGLGARDSVDSIRVDWPDGRVSRLGATRANQRLVIHQSLSQASVAGQRVQVPTLVRDITDSVALRYRHTENEFVDFGREPLMPKLLSREGPALAVTDVNGDGLDDMFIGGAKGQPGKLLVQRRDGQFVSSSDAEFAKDALSEDVGAAFFDANGDGRPDLYVVSGGNEYSEGASALQDRLYLNAGEGVFRKANGYLPQEASSGSRVAAADFDGDGDVDVFVGGRVVPWRYGVDPPSMLLRNDGTGHFTDVTDALAPELRRVGIVTDAVWRDVDGDRRPDLIVVGEWMPITIFHNAGGGRLTRSNVPSLAHSNGWWNRIIAGDFTGDGRVDFIVGNLGLNTRLQASEARPLTMYVKDFARTGQVQQVICVYNGTERYPLALRDALTEALPYLQRKYLTYEQYARARCEDVLLPDDVADAVVKTAETFATSLVRNNADGSFTLVPLPREAQIAPVYGLLATDLDRDGRTDLLLGGNFDGVQPEIGRMAASYGLVLRGDGKGHFSAVGASESGFVVPGETRDIQRIRTTGCPPARATGRCDAFVVARNDNRPLVFRAASARQLATY